MNDQQFGRLIYVLILGFGSILAWLTLGLSGLLIAGALFAAFEIWGLVVLVTSADWRFWRTIERETRALQVLREQERERERELEPVDYPFWSVGNIPGIVAIIGCVAILLGAVAAYLVALFT
jgi:hypothetical protein